MNMRVIKSYVDELDNQYFLVIPPQEGEGWEIDEKDVLTGMTPLKERKKIAALAATKGFQVYLEEMDECPIQIK